MKSPITCADSVMERSDTRSSMPWIRSPRGPKHTAGMPARTKCRASVVAVVASSAPAMPEVLGSAAVLCDPTDVDAWAAAVKRVCSDEDARQQLIESGRARAATYSWRASAEKLAALLKKS